MMLIEILMLLYREQTAASLFKCVEEQSKLSSNASVQLSAERLLSTRAGLQEEIRPTALHKNPRKRSISSNTKVVRPYGPRHSRFGGSFEVCSPAGAATHRRILTPAILRRQEGISDEGKTRRVIKVLFDADAVSRHESPPAVRICLYKHAVTIVRSCFNTIIPVIEDELGHMNLKQLDLVHTDRMYYLQMLR